MVNDRETLRKSKMDLEASYNGVKVVNYDLYERHNSMEIVFQFLGLLLMFGLGYFIGFVYFVL